MAKKVKVGRFTAQSDEPIVVFLIGMRINRFTALGKWPTTVRAMRPMLDNLYRYPEKGFLGAEQFFRWREAIVIQYWRSFEDLERFARNPSDPHLQSWQTFTKLVGSNGKVGLWHEIYEVSAHKFEAVYNNMPVIGLAKATNHVETAVGLATTRRRMQNEDTNTP